MMNLFRLPRNGTKPTHPTPAAGRKPATKAAKPAPKTGTQTAANRLRLLLALL
jgi:hypothetical protein